MRQGYDNKDTPAVTDPRENFVDAFAIRALFFVQHSGSQFVTEGHACALLQWLTVLISNEVLIIYQNSCWLTMKRGTMTEKTFTELLNWRYATKKMNADKAVPQDKLDAIIEAVRMAPTSSGTQPFELIVVSNPDLRAKIAEAAGGQTPITDGSHVLVFAAWDNYTEERIDDVLQSNLAARGDLPLIHDYYNNLKANYCLLYTSPSPRD